MTTYSLAFQEIELKAEDIFKLVNPDFTFPFPVEKAIEYTGFSGHLFSPDEETSSISGAVNHTEKKVYINEEEIPQRRLFTAAHELGHIVLHPKLNHVDFRDSKESRILKEKEADYFAACILMPKQIFMQQWALLYADINKIAVYFGTSKSAVNVRAKYLRLN